MRYHSNPKPVRIRFESGGEEHFSLDSLLACFNPFDIINKKNELLRWLSTQGDEGKKINEKLQGTEFSKKNCFQLYEVFFEDYITDKNITTIEDLLVAWYNSNEYESNYIYLWQFCCQDGEILLNLHNKNTVNLDEWVEAAERFVQSKNEVGQPKILYHLGQFYNQQSNQKKSIDYLQRASNLGDKEAEELLSEIEKVKEISLQELPTDIDIELIKDIINYCIRNYKRYKWDDDNKMLGMYWEQSKTAKKLNDAEMQFIQFAFSCKKISDYSLIWDKYKKARNDLKTSQEDPLEYEKKFIINMIGFNKEMSPGIKSESETNLLNMSRHYVPAYYIVFPSIPNEILDSEEFRKQNLSNQIDILLCHLFDFRNSECHVEKKKTSRKSGLPDNFDLNFVKTLIGFCQVNFHSYKWSVTADMIFTFWASGSYVQRQLSNEEKEFAKFTFYCCSLVRYSDIDEKYQKAKNFFPVEKGNILSKEKLFIIKLIGSQSNDKSVKRSCKSYLEKMNYVPAQYITNRNANKLLQSLDFKKISIDSQIGHFLNNLFVFR